MAFLDLRTKRSSIPPVPKRGKNIKRQDDRIKFPFSASIRELCHDSFQYSTNKNIQTANNINPSTGNCCKIFNISKSDNGLIACYCFIGTNFY